MAKGSASSFLLIGALAACSSGTTSAPVAADGGVPLDAAAAVVPGLPPPRPNAAAAGGGRATFAVRELWLGDSHRDAAMDKGAWQDFGYDLDGKTTERGSTDGCALAADAPPTTNVDGADGIDNSFGANLLPVLSTMKGHSLSRETTGYIATADTLVLDVTGLEADPSQTNVGLSLSLLQGAARLDKGEPDRWSVDPASLADGATLGAGAKHVLADAYVTGGVVVARAATPIAIAIPMGAGESIRMRVHSPIISFRHREMNVADDGLIAGVLDPNELLPELERGYKLWQPSAACTSSEQLATLESLVRNAVDVQLDGTSAAGSECRGISIGLGFRATVTAAPIEVAPPRAPRTDPCK